ncbi:MAG: CBS domain-containing protein [Deltaproteobacteria bacterium]|nr:CBS domain-containing protein [Deltaproteobacteria bacterium]
MSLLDIAYTPAPVIGRRETVRDAVAVTMPEGCDAVVVVDEEELVGIMTSRDIMLKVVLRREDPESVLVEQVMSAPVVTIHQDETPEKALAMMLENNIRHVVLIDRRKVTGLISQRQLLGKIVKEQSESLEYLAAFLSVEGSRH